MPNVNVDGQFHHYVKLILVVVGILGACTAQAQNAPWCLQSSAPLARNPL
jgi:hypothetical protein